MSDIRIYEAYRLRQKHDLWQLITEIHTTATTKVRSVLSEIYLRMVQDVAMHDEIRKVLSLPRETEIMPLEVSEYIGVMYQEQVGDKLRNPWSLDVSVSIREHDGRLYLIPYSDMFMHGVFGFLTTDKRLERFGFWEGLDRDQTCSPTEWAERERVWRSMVANWGCFLILEICSHQKFKTREVNPVWEIMSQAPWREQFCMRDTRRMKVVNPDEK